MGILKLVIWVILFLGCGLNNPFSPKKIPEAKPPKLERPLNRSTIGKGEVYFIWQLVPRKISYHFQLSKDENFSSPVVDTTIDGHSFRYKVYDTLGKYYWRVKVKVKPYNKWSNWSETWWFEVKNRAPITPHEPSPPNEGKCGTTISLYWKGGDPDLDTVKYIIFFKKNTPPQQNDIIDSIIRPSLRETTLISYTLEIPLEEGDTCYWKIKAKDIYGKEAESDIWRFFVIQNDPPNKPETPTTNATLQYIDVSYTFSTKTTDPEGDSVRYIFDFGDGVIYRSPLRPSGEIFNTTYIYRKIGNFYVKVKAEDKYHAESPWSDSIKITVKTGPGACWVALPKENKVVKLGIGGSKIYEIHMGDIDVVTMDVDQRPSPHGGFCWGASTYNQRVFKFSPDGRIVWMRIFFGAHDERNPSTPQVDREGNCWVTFIKSGHIVKLNQHDGDTIKTFYVEGAIPSVYRLPWAIALDTVRNYIWVIVPNSYTNPSTYPGYISRYNTAGTLLWRSPENFNGFYLEVNPINGDCWVVNILHPDEPNRQEIVRISLSGEIQRFDGFNHPASLCIDYKRNCVWITDTYNNRVVKMSFSGDRTIISGFNMPTGIEVDLQDGSCWVSDTENDRVVKLDANGNILFEVKNLIEPKGLAIDYRER